MKSTERIIQVLATVARIGAGVSFLVLIVAVLIQVTTRTMGNSPVWTEELTRFALLYLVAFGAGLSFRTGDMVNVAVVCENLPGRAPRMLRLLSAVATAGLALYLLPASWKYTSIGAMQTSPALGMQMTWAHVTITLLLALLAVFGALRIVGMLTGAEDGKPEKAIEAPEG